MVLLTNPLQATLCPTSLIYPDLTSVLMVFKSVTAYSTQSATLTLKHDYPKGNRVKVSADAALLLQNLNSEQTDIGQWIHVIGYITSMKKSTARSTVGYHPVRIGVQAIVLWIAKDLDVASYEKTLAADTE
ncbi:CST complex subunit Ten1 [Xylariaceae sp. FL0662B]|nr:CST complex subunit Ten1 [Xylariaceae sp. FL0662B]